MKVQKKLVAVGENTYHIFPGDVIRYIMKSSDLKTIVNLGKTCHFYNTFYRDMLMCKSFDQPCSSLMCALCPLDFDLGTTFLSLYAKEYEKDKEKNIQAKKLFVHLWQHNEAERLKGVADVLDIEYPSIDECISLYAGNYQSKFLCLIQCTDNVQGIRPGAIKTKLEQEVKQANSLKLKTFLYTNLVAAKTMVLGSPLLDYNYAGCFSYELKKKSLLECVFKTDNITIMRQLIKNDKKQNKPFFGIWWNLMCLSMRNNHDELLEKLICIHHDSALERRFFLWNEAMHCCYQKIETIVKLLFNDSIEVIGEHHGSLIDIAIAHKHKKAVDYLLAQGINVNTVDKYGRSLLYNAFDSIDITRLLLTKGADVNKAGDDGTTPLIALPQRYEWNKTREEVLRLLLQYGANVNMVDNEGKTVLHWFANLIEPHNCCNYKDAIKMIPLLLEYGADRNIKDKDDKTPLDYATANDSIEIIGLLTPPKITLLIPPKQAADKKIVPVSTEPLIQQFQKDKKENKQYKKSPHDCEKIIFYSFCLTTSIIIGLLLRSLYDHISLATIYQCA